MVQGLNLMQSAWHATRLAACGPSMQIAPCPTSRNLWHREMLAGPFQELSAIYARLRGCQVMSWQKSFVFDIKKKKLEGFHQFFVEIAGCYKQNIGNIDTPFGHQGSDTLSKLYPAVEQSTSGGSTPGSTKWACTRALSFNATFYFQAERCFPKNGHQLLTLVAIDGFMI